MFTGNGVGSTKYPMIVKLERNVLCNLLSSSNIPILFLNQLDVQSFMTQVKSKGIELIKIRNTKLRFCLNGVLWLK